jgi:hypothetical protein
LITKDSNFFRSHNFNRSLNRELQQQDLADRFYLEKMGVKNILRYNSGSEEHMQFQRKDIDLSFELSGRRVMVSEKFRSHDYGDLYLECYSKYPDTPGWMHQSKADFLACFFPERVIWLNKKKLVDFFQTKLWPAIPGALFAKINRELYGRSGQQKQQLEFLGKLREVTVIQAFNRSGKDQWHTIGIGLPLEMLEEFNIPGKIMVNG